MLTQAKRSFLNNDNITIPNSKIVVTISIPNPDEQVEIVQQNVT